MAKGRKSAGGTTAIAAALTAALALAATAAAAPGERDPGFGKRGVVRTTIAATHSAVAVDSDGRIVAIASAADGTSTLARFDRRGAPDLSFGSGGTEPVPGGPWEDVAIQPDGRILLAGSAEQSFAVARFEATGVPDTSFGGGDGIATTKVEPDIAGSPDATAREVLVRLALQPDGRILATGTAQRCYPGEEGAECAGGASVALRHAPDGGLDPGFGQGGVALLRVSKQKGLFEAASLALAPDDKVLVGGTGYFGGMTIARLDSSGSLDRTFAEKGLFTTRLDTLTDEEGVGDRGNAKALVVQRPGRIVAIGDRVLVGLRRNGDLDPSFGESGSASMDGPAFEEADFGAATVDKKGRIVVAGGGYDVSWVGRFFPDGRYDPRFAGDGIAGPDLAKVYPVDGGGPNQGLTAVALLPGGDLLAAGFAYRDKHHSELTLLAFRGGDGHLARCHGKAAVLQGTPGDDRLSAYGPIVAFGGKDRIVSYGGPVCAGGGDDFVTANNGPVYAGAGDDKVVWGYRGPIHGGPGDDVLRPKKENDSPDFVFGDSGADLLAGAGGPDRLYGGPGADRVVGGPGPDDLLGGAGEDTLVGGLGADRLDGHGESETVPGGSPGAVYTAAKRGFRIRLTVRGSRLTGLHVTVREHCTFPHYEQSTHNDNHLGLLIHADGRFHFSEDFRSLDEIDYTESLDGKVGPQAIVGSYSATSRGEEGLCGTGRKGHRQIHFVARRGR